MKEVSFNLGSPYYPANGFFQMLNSNSYTQGIFWFMNKENQTPYFPTYGNVITPCRESFESYCMVAQVKNVNLQEHLACYSEMQNDRSVVSAQNFELIWKKLEKGLKLIDKTTLFDVLCKEKSIGVALQVSPFWYSSYFRVGMLSLLIRGIARYSLDVTNLKNWNVKDVIEDAMSKYPLAKNITQHVIKFVGGNTVLDYSVKFSGYNNSYGNVVKILNDQSPDSLRLPLADTGKYQLI